MATVLSWTLGAITAYVLLVPAVFFLVMEVTDRVRPREGLPRKSERSWIAAGALMMRIAGRMEDGEISPAIADRRVRRIERYAAKRLAAPEHYEEWALGGMDFAKDLVRAKRRKETPSPSAWIH